MRSLFALALLTACSGGGDPSDKNDGDPTTTPTSSDPTSTDVDRDGDGVAADTDCDDTNALVFPGAEELCNYVDDNCDGLVDIGVEDGERAFLDTDGDGFGTGEELSVCRPDDEGLSPYGSDCNDSDADVYPGADERCNDQDDDCDDQVDDNPVDAVDYYADVDGDGYGDPASAQRSCSPVADHVTNNEDCDDTDDALTPDTVWYVDDDYDGFGGSDSVVSCDAPAWTAAASDDCDDTRNDVHPGATEWCDGVDNDCNGTVDRVRCDDWEGSHTGSFDMLATDGFIETYCSGTVELDIDRDTDPAVTGTVDCDGSGSTAFGDSQQDGVFEGRFQPDGTVEGTLTHEYDGSCTWSLPFDGVLDGALGGTGSQDVCWFPGYPIDITYEVTLDL